MMNNKTTTKAIYTFEKFAKTDTITKEAKLKIFKAISKKVKAIMETAAKDRQLTRERIRLAKS